MNIKLFNGLVAGGLLSVAAAVTALPLHPSHVDASAEIAYGAAIATAEAQLKSADEGALLVAQKDDKRRMRQKSIKTEASIKRVGDKTSIDFEAADITGARRTPLGSMINQNRADKDYNFVRMRLTWHPEMVSSAASLDTQND